MEIVKIVEHSGTTMFVSDEDRVYPFSTTFLNSYAEQRKLLETSDSYASGSLELYDTELADGEVVWPVPSDPLDMGGRLSLSTRLSLSEEASMCEELGWAEGDLFTVSTTESDYFEHGETVRLLTDDQTRCPLFESLDDTDKDPYYEWTSCFTPCFTPKEVKIDPAVNHAVNRVDVHKLEYGDIVKLDNGVFATVRKSVVERSGWFKLTWVSPQTGELCSENIDGELETNCGTATIVEVAAHNSDPWGS